MNEYLIVKTIHVISSTILFGTGMGSAFYMFVASRGRDPRTVYFVTRWVVVADWVFTTTAIVAQAVTGLWLVYLAGFPLTSAWILWSIVLYFVAGACWLPVVWMQIQMRDMARTAAEEGTALPQRYQAYFRIWVALGIPAFLALVAVFYLMVAKPLAFGEGTAKVTREIDGGLEAIEVKLPAVVTAHLRLTPRDSRRCPLS